jgi:hypothetical protein
MSLVSAFQGPYLRFTLVAAGLFLFCLYFFCRRTATMYATLRRKWNPPSPYDPTLLRFERNAVLFWLPFVIISALLVLTSFYLSSYRYVGDRASPAGSAVFKRGAVQYTDNRGQALTVPWRGSRAAAGGIFLRFPKWVGFTGLGTYEKLITFRSIEENQYHYQQPNDEWLAAHGADTIFRFLHRNRKFLKFPEAVYVESPYFSGPRRTLIITRNGYIID